MGDKIPKGILSTPWGILSPEVKIPGRGILLPPSPLSSMNNIKYTKHVKKEFYLVGDKVPMGTRLTVTPDPVKFPMPLGWIIVPYQVR